MITIIVIGIVSVLLLYYLFEQQRTKRIRKMLSKVPSPRSYPFVGSALAFGSNSVELLRNMQYFSKEYGPVVAMWMGPTPYVLLSDSNDIETILSNTINLDKPQVYQFLKKWLGTGLVSAPGTKWKTHRKILTPAFHFKILESYIDIFNENTKIMMSLLDKEVGKEKFDISPFIDKCTLDIICETAMATSIHAQLNKESQFTKALKVASTAILVRSFSPWLFPECTFDISSLGRQFNESLGYINSFVDKVIAEKKNDMAKSKINGVKPSEEDLNVDQVYHGKKKQMVFLDLILMYASDPSIHLSDEDIRDEVNTFMFAGHDTTASTIGFAVYLLGSHPDVQDRVLDEVMSVLGDSDEDPTYQQLLSLKYLEQVIKETLRLYPGVPYIARTLAEDLTLPSGYTLPTGCAVTLFLFNMHRDSRVFPDPETFNPDNFLPERLVGRSAFTYTPFSAGPRNCIGQKFAMLEMKVTLSRLVRSYKITAVDPEPLLASELILRSETGINIRLDKRK